MKLQEAKKQSAVNESLTTTLEEPLVTVKALVAFTGLSDTTLWRQRRRGELPEPIKLSSRRVGWTPATIRAWLARRGTV